MVELFTSTGEGSTSDFMIARFSFASTGKCNSMIELFTSKGEGFDSTIVRFSFASTAKCNSMQWSNYLPQRAKVLAQRSNLTPQRAKNIVNQRANIATGEKYCEWAAKHIKISCFPREY